MTKYNSVSQLELNISPNQTGKDCDRVGQTKTQCAQLINGSADIEPLI